MTCQASRRLLRGEHGYSLYYRYYTAVPALRIMGALQLFHQKKGFDSLWGRMGEGEDGKESSVLTFFKLSVFKSL